MNAIAFACVVENYEIGRSADDESPGFFCFCLIAHEKGGWEQREPECWFSVVLNLVALLPRLHQSTEF